MVRMQTWPPQPTAIPSRSNLCAIPQRLAPHHITTGLFPPRFFLHTPATDL